jgi:hypothetical protein
VTQDKASLRAKAKEYQKFEARTQFEIFNLEKELDTFVEDWNEPAKSENSYLGVFRGLNVRYLMKSRQVTIFFGKNCNIV